MPRHYLPPLDVSEAALESAFVFLYEWAASSVAGYADIAPMLVCLWTNGHPPLPMPIAEILADAELRRGIPTIIADAFRETGAEMAAIVCEASAGLTVESVPGMPMEAKRQEIVLIILYTPGGHCRVGFCQIDRANNRLIKGKLVQAPWAGAIAPPLNPLH